MDTESHHCFAKYLDIGITRGLYNALELLPIHIKSSILLKYMLPLASVADHSKCPTSL